MTESTRRGGSGRGQGRKPVQEGAPTVTVSLRMTAAQRDRLRELGGAQWVRQQIDVAQNVHQQMLTSAKCAPQSARRAEKLVATRDAG